MRRSLLPLHHHPVGHAAGLQVATDESQHPLVPDALLQPSHQHVVVDAVEERFQVHIHHHPLPVLDVLLRLAHGIVCAAPGSETVAVFREGGVEHRLKHLQDALLKKPVEHGWDAKFPRPTPALGYLHFPHRLRLVGASEQLRSDGLPIVHQVLRQLVDGHPIDAGTALVLPHALQRRLGVATLDHPFHQAVVS